MKNAYRGWMAAGLMALCGGTALAAEGTSWDRLTPAQQQLLLQVHQDRWNHMPADKQQRMLEGAERWQKMSPEARRRIAEKREKFHSMSPEEREELRGHHHERREAFSKLPPEQQQAIRDCKDRRRAGEDVDCRSLWPERPGRDGDEKPARPQG